MISPDQLVRRGELRARPSLAPAGPRRPEPAAPRLSSDVAFADATAQELQALDGALDRVRRAVQCLSDGTSRGDTGAVHARAAAGARAPNGPLPYAAPIQRAFGAHDLSDVRAHVSPEATRAVGARAYATGGHVVFRAAPDLRTAAHEAAHVVQQQAGVQLPSGVGRAGDACERQADAVADAVVAGRSAESLLDSAPGGGGAQAPGGAAAPALQRIADETEEQENAAAGDEAATPASAPEGPRAADEAISTFRGGVSVYAQPGGGTVAFRIGRGVDVKVVEDALHGWVKIAVEGGPAKGREGYIAARYLLPEVAPDDYQPTFARVSVILFQGADNAAKLREGDVDDRQYLSQIATSLAGARPNTVGCDLDSGKLILGAPIEYNTGQDIVRALQVVGAAVAAKECAPGVFGRIGEVHVLGHSTDGIHGATHQVAEGLYSDEEFDRKSVAPYEARAPFAGRIAALPYGVGDVLELESSHGGDLDTYRQELFRVERATGDGATLGPAEGASFSPREWYLEGRVVEVYHQVGDRVDAGEPVLSVRRGQTVAPEAARMSELEPVVRTAFADDVCICLHGCALAAGTDSFAERLFALVKGALGEGSRPKVYARPEVGGTQSRKVREFSDEYPGGSGEKAAPKAFRMGL